MWVSISVIMILYDIALETHKGPTYIFNNNALNFLFSPFFTSFYE